MSIEISAEGIDRAIAAMQDALNGLGGKTGAKVIANALNQSLAAGRKQAAREARKAYTAPIKKLFDNIHIQRAKGGSLEAKIELSGTRGVSLIHFQAKPNLPQPPAARPAQGITAKTKRKGSRKVRFSPNGGSKSFIMRKKQGGFGVFVRHNRKKFEMLYGPSPIQALQRADVQESVRESVEAAFVPRLEQEIDRALARTGSGK